jgi:hypothetical protein
MKIMFGKDLYDFLELFERQLFEMLELFDLILNVIFLKQKYIISKPDKLKFLIKRRCSFDIGTHL